MIPAAGRAAFNIRFNDLHTSASLRAWAEETAAREVAGTDLTAALDWNVSGESFVTQPGPRVEAVAAAIAAATNHQPKLTTGGGTSDARFIKDLCPVMEFGLVGDTMHQVDERVPVASIRALSRIYLDNILNVQSSWVTQGLKTCQVGLRFGGNDVGSIMIEENVVSAAGAHNKASEEELRRLIRDAGFTPKQRDTLYRTYYLN